MGIGGGSSQSQSESVARDPGGGVGAGILADLFGVGTTLKEGKFVLGGLEERDEEGRPTGRFRRSASEGLAGDFRGIKTLFGQSASADQFNQARDVLGGFLQSGGIVDTSAALRSGLTDIREQFSGIGNLFSSDVQNEALRFAGELNVGAQEAAKQRQLEALTLQPQFAQAFEAANTTGGRALSLFKSLFGGQSADLFSEGADSSEKSSSFDFAIA